MRYVHSEFHVTCKCGGGVITLFIALFLIEAIHTNEKFILDVVTLYNEIRVKL